MKQAVLFVVASGLAVCGLTTFAAQQKAQGGFITRYLLLEWNTSVDKVEPRIRGKRDFRMEDDSTFVYEDTTMTFPSKVILKFAEAKSTLKTIAIQFADPDTNVLKSIHGQLSGSYGEPQEKQDKEQTKFFITVHTTTRIWSAQGERIELIEVSRGDKLLGLALRITQL